MDASCVEEAKSLCSANNISKGASKVEDNENKALIAVLVEGIDATKRKLSIVGLELKNALKPVSTHIGVKSKAAILRIGAELYHDDSEELRNAGTCPSRVAKSRGRSLS